MNVLSALLPLLAGCCLVLGLVAIRKRIRSRPRKRRRGGVVFHPGARAFLREQGLLQPEHFLERGTFIVGGHPDRDVARVTLGTGPDPWICYLKRERRVSWLVRLLNFLAGFGLVSRSLREAQTLDALERDGLPAPRWLAVGEDDAGQAFLLVRAIPGAIDLATFLRQYNGAFRRNIACQLGITLARFHNAGFAHGDLYAKHVLIDPETETIQFVDFQRTPRCGMLSTQQCCRDLAALDATLDNSLASARDRLACLRAYLRNQNEIEGVGSFRLRLRALVIQVATMTRRLLGRRHIREKRHPLPPAEVQAWICLEGDALCVTPAMRQFCPDLESPQLAILSQPLRQGQSMTRRWLSWAGNRRTLLVRWRTQSPRALFWSWLLGRPRVSPEQRQAALLFRLQRHAVAAARVLAMGQQGGPVSESFLLTEPVPNTVRLEAWLQRPVAQTPTVRHRVLHQAGALLQQLHNANCYLDERAGGSLAVQVPLWGEPAMVLDGVEGVSALRRRQQRRARRDVGRVQQMLLMAGCGRTDLERFLAGYREKSEESDGVISSQLPVLKFRPSREQSPVNHDTFWHRLRHGLRRLRQRADWSSFAGPDWPEDIMTVAVTDRFHAKQGRSTGRWVLRAPGSPGEPDRCLTVYLKRHHELPRWRGLLAVLWPGGDWSPAMQEWHHLEWARGQGLPVPVPVAAGEFIGPGGRLQSFLAVEELTDMLPLHEAIPLAAMQLPPALFRRWKRGLVAEMARLARQLHDRRYFHKDLYLCHFYIHRNDTSVLPPEGWRGRVSLIDLHRLARHPWTWRMWQLKDLAQLLYSSEIPGVDFRDQVWFWRNYRGVGVRCGAGRWLRRCVLFKWRRYRAHNLRRKACLRQTESGGQV
jgi:heptose I phosphotransferase